MTTFSNDLSLELMVTGEKAGLWGNTTNTNLKVLETATAYNTFTINTGNTNLLLTDGSSTATGKFLFTEVTGTLTGNCTLTMAATTSGGSAKRVFFIKDGTNRTTSNFTITILTTGQAAATQVPVPTGATLMIVSDGSTTTSTLVMSEGAYKEINSATNTTYTAVAGDQLYLNTTTNPITITLPAIPAVGNEIVIGDGFNTFQNNKCTINPNTGINILGSTAAVDLTTGSQVVTLVYANVTRGWIFKTNTA